jgi:chromosome segregation ATPase
MNALVFLALLLGPCGATSVTPIQKVIQMLTDMQAKGKAEKEDEAVSFAEYKTFCKDTAWDKTTSIKTATAAIEQLSADIDKGASDAAEAAKAISTLDADITAWKKDITVQTRERKEAKGVFDTVHADYTESIDAVARALAVLKASPGQSAASLIQVKSLMSLSKVPAQAKNKILAFLQNAPTNALLQDAEMLEQPQAKAVNYESSSGSIIEMVESLGDKFEDERAALEEKESTEKHSYDMMMQDLNSQVSHATEELDSKTAFKAKTEEDKATNEGDLSDTSASKAADEKFLADLTAECEQKAIDFEARQKTRQEELDAIGEAIGIMSSDTVAGSGTKHLPQFIQKKGSALAQLRASSTSSVQQAVATYLNDQAARQNSRILSLLATKVAADPFKKIVKMIKDMIVKLTEEAQEEAEHKGFCDSELGSNKATRDTKTEESDTLKANIEELTADIAKLAEQISELSAAIASLDKAMAEATAQRTGEKEKNTITIADAKAGKEAVARAMTVLKTYYDKAATNTALIQNKVPGAPETFDKAYTGMEGGGVMGMLEVCESDFARLESETTAGEAENAKSYDEFMADSTSSKDAKTAEMKDKEAEKQAKESAKAQAEKDLKGVSEELTAALAYYEKLKPSCIDAGESYEERVARRKEEIESLKEALKILNGESV